MNLNYFRTCSLCFCDLTVALVLSTWHGYFALGMLLCLTQVLDVAGNILT